MKGFENMCDMKQKLEVDFFDFAAERVWFIGENITEETDKELEALSREVQESVEPKLWRKYEMKDSLYHDRTMYCAYKQGFIDALRLFETSQAIK